jgi:D-alanyl-D-alanine carboxypeptidase
MGAPTEAARDDDTLSLLRYGFSLYRSETPVRRGARLRVARVPNGEHNLSLVAARPVRATVRRGQSVDVRVHAPRSVAAPIQRGDRLGSAIVAVGGSPAGRTPLLAGRAVSVAATPLIARVDDALPGPRAATWALISVAGAAIVIGIALAAARSRRE